MPITRDQADAIIKHIRLTWEGTDGDLNITYRPNLLSRTEFQRLQQIAERGEDSQDEGLAPLLARAIISMDFNREDGTPYPIEPDTFSILGYPIQYEIVTAMVQSPNAPSGTRSGRGSAAIRTLPAIESQSAASSSSAPATGTSMSAY